MNELHRDVYIIDNQRISRNVEMLNKMRANVRRAGGRSGNVHQGRVEGRNVRQAKVQGESELK